MYEIDEDEYRTARAVYKIDDSVFGYKERASLCKGGNHTIGRTNLRAVELVKKLRVVHVCTEICLIKLAALLHLMKFYILEKLCFGRKHSFFIRIGLANFDRDSTGSPTVDPTMGQYL